MSSDLSARQWEQVKDLFTAALDHQPGERTAFLHGIRGSDSAVRVEVERLLAEHEQASSFLARPALGWAQTGEADLGFPAEMIGRTLSHYEIVERLGEGGMGVVYKARDLQLDRLVALKLLPGEMAADPERERRLVKEAKAASALNHPNIITIHETGVAEGVSFIVMESVEGETLDRILARRRLSLAEAWKYGVQVADALSAAHAAGIVHLDLKPSNIMVRHDGWIKVLDFGLAKRRPPLSRTKGELPGKEVSKTEEGGIFGTASYMSPEQAEGKSVDSRSDIFSFATVLYEMIAGKKPFRGDTPISTLAAILTQQPEPLSKIVDHMPAQLEALLERCFCKDPANRFPYAEDLKVALEELRQQYDSGLVARRAIAHHSAPRRFHTVLWALLFAGLLAAVGIWKWPASPPVSQPLTEVPITFYPGLQINPSLSRDGAEVAFAWSKVGQVNFHIFIKTTIGPDEPLPLTRDPAPDLYPALSPDGAQVAFLRFVGAGRAAVMLVSKFGKSERKIADVGTLAAAQPSWTALLIGPVLSWSPDGKYIAAPDQDRSGPLRIVLISVETGEKRRLTEPAPEDFPGDVEVSFSPNGQSLAFTRFLGLGQARLFRLDLSADLRPNGAPRLIRTGIPDNHSPSWTPDGRELLFSSGWQQRLGIWRIDASGRGTARQVPTPDLSAFWPVSNGLSKRLVYGKAEIETSNWELALGPSGLPAGKPTPINRTTRKDISLDYQPGGGRIAFLSDRGGRVEIWVADRDGSNEHPLVAATEHPIYGPKWSPDGKQILYIANPDGETHLYAIGVDGGRSRRLTSRPAYAVTPQWSPDGQWVLYTEGRSGQPEIWKMKVEGGEPIQVTKDGGIAPKTSSDGAFIYYKKSMISSEIWRLPAAGGAEERLFGTSGLILDFAANDKGIYLAVNPVLDEDSGSIQYFDLAARKIEEIYRTPKPLFIGLGISPDRNSLTYSQIERAEIGLMRVEHFQ